MLSPHQARHFAALGNALGELRKHLDSKATFAPMRWRADNFTERSGVLTDAWSDAIEHLMTLINGPFASVAADDSVDESAMHRVAGRLLEALDHLRRLRHEATVLPVVGRQVTARELVVGGFDYTLVEISRWLDTLLDFLADPTAALRRRGIAAEGAVEFPLSLKLTAAPHWQTLTQWLQLNT